MITNPQKKMLALSALGGAIEFYDFITFIFFTKILSQLFFPLQNKNASLMATFGVFAVGYLARPLGGIVFGHCGDKSGRKKTFITSVILMAVPTLLIGLLPSYQSIGIIAPVLLIFLRLMQGFSVGGEIPGAIVYAAETVQSNHRALACGLIFFGVNSGLLFGSLVSSQLMHHLSSTQLVSWGWRLPFILGGLLGIVSFYLRKNLRETAVFIGLQQFSNFYPLPFKEIVLRYPKQVLQGIGITCLQAVLMSILFLYLPTYLSTYFSYSLPALLSLNTLAICGFSFVNLFTSYISDRIGRIKLMWLGVIFFLLFTYPLFALFALQHFYLVVLIVVIMGLMASPIVCSFAPILAELFPTRVRYSGVALTYNIAFAFCGGLTPLIATYLIHVTHYTLAPCFWLIFIAVLAGVALISIPETFKKEL